MYTRLFKILLGPIIILNFLSCEKYETFLTSDWEESETSEYWFSTTWKRIDTDKQIYLDLSSETPVFCGMGGNMDNIFIGSISWNSDYSVGRFEMRDKISGTEVLMQVEKTDENNLVLSLIDISTGDPYSPGYYNRSGGWCN